MHGLYGTISEGYTPECEPYRMWLPYFMYCMGTCALLSGNRWHLLSTRVLVLQDDKLYWCVYMSPRKCYNKNTVHPSRYCIRFVTLAKLSNSLTTGYITWQTTACSKSWDTNSSHIILHWSTFAFEQAVTPMLTACPNNVYSNSSPSWALTRYIQNGSYMCVGNQI